MIRQAAKPVLTTLLLLASSLAIAAAPGPLGGGLEQAHLVDATDLDGELFHVQGLELEHDRVWVTSVDRASRRGYLHEFDRESGKLLRRLNLTDGGRYHPGGMSIADGSIWVPVAELRPDSSAVLLEIDVTTLEVRRRISVADHLGCVAATGDTLVAGNWGSKLLYVFDLSESAVPRTVPNPSPTHFQDMKFVSGQIVAGGTRSWWSGTVDWIDWPSLTVTRSLRAGAIGPIRPFGRGGPFTGEGLAIEGGDLYLLPEDGPSRLFRFRLDEQGRAL